MTNRTVFSGFVRRFAIAAALTAPLALLADNPSDLHLSNLTISSGSASYAAGNSILADNGVTISGSASVTFETCNYIRLDPGFQATAGSATQTFQAVIDPVAVSVAPASTTLRPGESRQFIVGANAPCSTAVTWSPPGVGSISASFFDLRAADGDADRGERGGSVEVRPGGGDVAAAPAGARHGDGGVRRAVSGVGQWLRSHSGIRNNMAGEPRGQRGELD